MAKTKETQVIEYQVFKHLYLRWGYRVALEVGIPDEMALPQKLWGRCDIVAIKDNIVICVEIKISVADFKSKNGHNLVGTKNYLE